MKKHKLVKKLTLCLVIPALLSVLTVLAGCDNIVPGSGETATYEWQYSDFTRVEISAGFDIEITRADTYFVSVTLDTSLHEYLTIGQRGDTLLVGLKSNYTYTAADRQAIIHLPDLRRLELSGGSNAVVTGFSVTHTLDFELSGASRLVLNPLQTGDASFVLSGVSTAKGDIRMNAGKFNLSGSSTLELTGAATNIKIDASGASGVTFTEFPAATASVKLSGVSSAVINVSDLLDVDLSDTSNLEYIGNPKLGGMDMSGGSKLTRR